MKPKHIKLSPEATEDLRNATITDNRLDLPGQCKKYNELKKIFSEIGVTWSKKDKTHYLSEGAKEQIDFILAGGKIVDQKKTLNAFFTPKELAARVVELAEVNGKVCLEPSAGHGALADEMRSQGAAAETVLVEICPEFVKVLKDKGYGVNEGDFLKQSFPVIFDRIIANPPFERSLWVKFIKHSWNFLKPGGRMACICPNSRENKDFKDFVKGKNYRIEDVEEKAFSEAGTNVRTMIVIIDKDLVAKPASGATFI